MRPSRLIAVLPLALVLGGCDLVVLNPAGDIAGQERNLILASTGLMLLIVLPVMIATAVFAWHYRSTNRSASYAPDWHHSTQLEVLIWTAPLLIIIALGALTWISTHVLDPFRAVSRIDAARPVEIGTPPLVIEAVALDWKWLFIYPEQGIATVNEIAAPLDQPVEFRITSATVMNTFFVPTLAGQIYAMAGMETKLGAVINKPGTYLGYSGMYSGAGFSDMNFKFYGMAPKDFDAWVAKAKAAEPALDGARYLELDKPSEAVKPMFFSSVEPGLFERIVNMCVEPGKMCLDRMMAIDATGGVAGEAGAENRAKLLYDGARTSEGNEAPGATFPASGRPPNTNVAPQGMKPNGLTPDVNPGAPKAGEGAEGAPGGENPAPKQLNNR